MKSLAPSRSALLAVIESALQRIALAADRAYHTLMSEAEAALLLTTGATSALIVQIRPGRGIVGRR